MRQEHSQAELGVTRRFWRGEVSLGASCWAAGIVFLFLQYLQMRLLGDLAGGMSLQAGAWVSLSRFLLTALLLFVYCMGVWRAAVKRSRQGVVFFPAIARLGVLCAVAMFGFLSVSVLWSPLREQVLIAVGKDPLAPLEASVTTEASVLLLHGTFGSGSAQRARLLLDATPSIKTVALASPGGRLREAAEIAELVRRRRLDTYVDTRCESACTFVFLAGHDRAATPNARIGFHRPSIAGRASLGFDQATEKMLDTYRQAGIPQSFLDRVAATDPANMWYPSRNELEKAGVINRVSLGGETSALGYLALSSRQEVESAFRKVPMMVAMDRHFPGTIEAAVRAAWMERTQGGVDSAVGNAARSVVGERYPRILAAANDESLDVFANIMVEQMKAANAISAEACKMLLAGKLNIAQVLSPDLVRREQEWALQVLQAEKLVERESVDTQLFQATMSDATSVLPPEVLEVVRALETYDDQPERQCTATIALYDHIVKLPADDRHLLLRGMFQSGSL